MDISKCTAIEGAAKLQAIFGHWPTFAGATIIYARIDRKGPTITIAFELTEWADEHPDERVNATIRWSGVTGMQLSAVGSAMTIDGLTLSQTGDELKTTMRRGRSSHGQIVASSMRVQDVVIIAG